jgi:hypothetical protein
LNSCSAALPSFLPSNQTKNLNGSARTDPALLHQLEKHYQTAHFFSLTSTHSLEKANKMYLPSCALRPTYQPKMTTHKSGFRKLKAWLLGSKGVAEKTGTDASDHIKSASTKIPNKTTPAIKTSHQATANVTSAQRENLLKQRSAPKPPTFYARGLRNEEPTRFPKHSAYTEASRRFTSAAKKAQSPHANTDAHNEKKTFDSQIVAANEELVQLRQTIKQLKNSILSAKPSTATERAKLEHAKMALFEARATLKKLEDPTKETIYTDPARVTNQFRALSEELNYAFVEFSRASTRAKAQKKGKWVH